MAKDEFDIGQMIGGVVANIESLKEMMTRQHGDTNARLDLYMSGQKETEKVVAIIDRKVEAANSRLDAITDPDGDFMTGIKYAHNYNENKKKVSFLMTIILGIGAAIGWVISTIDKMVP